ncbi:MAG: NUDIX hydrolase [Rhizobiaceae bacterium]
MSASPITGCSVIVFEQKKVLLIKRGKQPYRGCWSLPGGSQELGETLEECARRELKEETCLDAGRLEFAAVRDRISRNEDGYPDYHFVLTTFFTTSFTGEAMAGDDAVNLGWFGLEEMRELSTTPETVEFVREVLKSR